MGADVGGLMRAMVMKGGSLEMRQVKTPQIKDDEVLIKVVAAGVNRCDLILPIKEEEEEEEGPTQRVGCFLFSGKAKAKAQPKAELYYCPGHECAGTILAIGRNVVGEWKVGDRVCAIVDNGAYAEQVAVPANQLLPVPLGVPFANAACLPYAACSAWLALSDIQQPANKEILIHDGASEIGAMAIRVAKTKGMKVIATEPTGHPRRSTLCQECGAYICINTKTTKGWDDTVRRLKTRFVGVDFILDCGSSYLPKNLNILGERGKLLVVDLKRDAKRTVLFDSLFTFNMQLQVINLRTECLDQKASLVAQVRENLWPAIERGEVVLPVIGRRLPLTAATTARELMGSDRVIGNILLYP